MPLFEAHFSEDELLPLSGLQHLAFCPRQWPLIHLEQVWAENQLTAEGRERHERVHEETRETRHGVRTVRSLQVHSLELGISASAMLSNFRWKLYPADNSMTIWIGWRALIRFPD